MQPRILVLNRSGVPYMWADVEQAIMHHAKNQVVWSVGESQYTLHGGINRMTGNRSQISTSSIIAVDGNYFTKTPRPTRELLFKRDQHICAYCGVQYKDADLTIDHVVPKYHKGENSWTNYVSACAPCNHRKGSRTPEQAGMKLLYLPYEPNINEAFILLNRRILADQMEFLVNAGLGRNSRICVHS